MATVTEPEAPSVPEPEPATKATNPTRIAIATATVVGAVALPGARVGVGWTLIALAVLGAVVIGRGAGRSAFDRFANDSGADRQWRIAAGIAAVALTGVPAIRASEWLTVLCLLAAAPLASYALAGGRSWFGIVEGATAVVPAFFRGLGWTASAAPTTTPKAARIAGGIAVGTFLLLVFGSLFRAADPDFAKLIDSWAIDLSAVDPRRAVLGGVLALAAAIGATYLVQHRRPVFADATPPAIRRALSIAEWAIPLVMLDALFGLFVWVQVTVLFGGDAYVLSPGGPNYAVHARGGFLQLTVVTALTLVVVAALAAWARRDSPAQAQAVRILGGALCALTLVIVASALKRLWLYATAYGFTVPRLLGFSAEVWLGLVFLLILLAGIRLQGAWLPRAITGAAVVVLFGLVAVNPDALIARTDLARLDGPYAIDSFYVSQLSADALDEILSTPMPADERACLTVFMRDDLRSADPWYAWNLARQRARAWTTTNQAARCHGV